MQKNYSQEMQPAIVGMLADTTFKTTDSYHVEDEKGVNAGVPVIPGTDAGTQVKACGADDGAKVIGVTMFVHKQLTDGENYYDKGYVVPVVTKGRVWVAVEGDVVAQTAAKYDATKKVWSATGTVEVANAKFITANTQDMAVVQIG